MAFQPLHKMADVDKSGRFLSVTHAHKGIIYKVINAYCKDVDDRKDLEQEIIVQLWKSFECYNEQYMHSTWIFRITLNVAISFYRKESRRKTIAYPFTESVLSISAGASTDDHQEEIVLLNQFINELRELDKALMLLYLEEKSYREIAEIMGISESNVATKISRIKTKLKQRFTLIENE